MKDPKVYVYPLDLEGCGRYRLIFASLALKERGYPIELVLPGDRNNNNSIRFDGEKAVCPPDADVVVIQRPTFGPLTSVIEEIRESGVTVVVDIDDDLSHIHPGNAAAQYLNPKNSIGGHNYLNLNRACMAASMVTVSSPALSRTYAPHGRYSLVNNYVPEWYLKVKHHDSDGIGWAGGVHSHPDDLPALSRATRRLGFSQENPFRVVGPPDNVADHLSLPPEAVSATGRIDIDRWPALIGYFLGIGTVPLADTRFNAAKSWLKGLEYSAVGVPWVASNRAEYRRLVDAGIKGYLADSPKEWVRHLTALRDSPELRSELSLHNRAVIADRMTVEKNLAQWWYSWVDAYSADVAYRS